VLNLTVKQVVRAAAAVFLFGVVASFLIPARMQGQRATAATPAAVPSTPDVMPQYDASHGDLRLPDGYRQWVLVGSSLGLSYAPAGQSGHQTFNSTLMEPTAYRHFLQTGEFREGTMLALIVQGVGTNVLPAREGQFASDIHGVEMAVKDKSRVPEGWAYYGFGSPSSGLRATAKPNPKASCFDCHSQHAARDNVFTQFYGLLNDVAR
jgi:hypothetical protein